MSAFQGLLTEKSSPGQTLSSGQSSESVVVSQVSPAGSTAAGFSVGNVLYYDEYTSLWRTNTIDLLGDAELEKVCYVFLDRPETTDWYQEKCDEAKRRKMLEKFGVPAFLSNQTSATMNGYFGCRPSYRTNQQPGKPESELESIDMWFRILTKKVLGVFKDDERPASGKDYVWYEMSFFLSWSGPGSCRLLCLSTPPTVGEGLANCLAGKSSSATSPVDLDFRDPFAMLRPLLEEMIKICDENTWRVAKLVRKIEKLRTVQPDFEKLHDLLRHAAHVVEVEGVAAETISRLLDRQKTNFESIPSGPGSLDDSYKDQAREYLAFQMQVMRSLKARAEATHGRLQGEINLAFNMLASTDNKIMKSITILTMIFLPATFVSGLFSTTFFSFDPNGWGFSSMFWVYWLVTVPLSVVVFAVWWRFLGGSLEVVRTNWMGKNGKNAK